MHTEFIQRTKATVARAHLADELQQQVEQLRASLSETQSREQRATEKLRLFLEQFRSQTDVMRDSANSALQVRRKLEADAAALTDLSSKQAQEIAALKASLDAAKVELSRAQSRSSASVLQSLLESPLSDERQREAGSSRKVKRQQQHYYNFDGSNNNSTVVILSPPPAAARSSGENNSNNNNSVAFAQQATSTNLLNSRRMKRLVNASFGQQGADDQQGATGSPSASDNHHHHHHAPRLSLYERQQCSARLAARICLACFPTRVLVERCAPLCRLSSSSGENGQQHQQIVAFRVGQLVSGWWKFCVTSVQLPTHAVNRSSTNNTNHNSNTSSSSSTAAATPPGAASKHLAAAQLPVSVSASLSMRRPPRGTRADFSSMLECQAEAALFTTAQAQFHRASSSSSSTSSSSSSQQQHYSTSALSALEFVASWAGLRPKHLRPVSLTTQNELEAVLDHLINTSNSLDHHHHSSEAAEQTASSASSSAASVLYLTNQFSRRECFVVDSTRIGRERLCCCVAVAGLGMLGSCVVVDASGSSSPTTKGAAIRKGSGSNLLLSSAAGSPLPMLEAAWLSLDEVRESFSTCICVAPFYFNSIAQSSGGGGNSKSKSLVALLRSHTPSYLISAASASRHLVAAPTEIRFACLLDERGATAGGSANVRLVLRGINTTTSASWLEKIEEWISQFSVDFYVNDVALLSVDEWRRMRNNNADDDNGVSHERTVDEPAAAAARSLRTDIACDGAIRWSFVDAAAASSAPTIVVDAVAEIAREKQDGEEAGANVERSKITGVTSPLIQTRTKTPPRKTSTSAASPVTAAASSSVRIPRTNLSAVPAAVTNGTQQQRLDSSISSSSTSNNIVMRFSCVDTNTVALAIPPGSRVCSAVCVVHIPPPPPPPSLSSSGCCVPNKTSITLYAGNAENGRDAATTTFQVNAETLPSSSGALVLVCGERAAASSSSSSSCLLWHLAGSVGGGGGGALRKHSSGGNDTLIVSPSSAKRTRAQENEMFAFALAAAEAWLGTASAWLTRFNTFKALLLIDSHRAISSSSSSAAAAAAAHSKYPSQRRAFFSPVSSSSISASSGGASPSTVYLAHALNSGAALSLSSSSTQQQQKQVTVTARQNMFVQFVLVCRFSDWMHDAAETFAWMFDATVSVFYQESARLLSFPLHRYQQQQPQQQHGKNSFADPAFVARAINFTSPVSADGGDDFLFRDDDEQSVALLSTKKSNGDVVVASSQQQQQQQQTQWSCLCFWQREFTRHRLELLQQWGDCVAQQAAFEFANLMNEQQYQQQQKSQQVQHQQQQQQRQYVTRNPQSSARADSVESNNNSGINNKSSRHQGDVDAAPSTSRALQTAALTDRCSALQMECEALALRLDAAEKRSAASATHSAALQQRLDEQQRANQLIAGELHRTRAAADSSLRAAIDNERFIAAREVAAGQSRCAQLEEEMLRKNALLDKYRAELETQQRDRLARYSEMLKELGSAATPHKRNDTNPENEASSSSSSSVSMALNAFMQEQQRVAASTSTMFATSPSHQALVEQQRRFRGMMESLKMEQREIEVDAQHHQHRHIGDDGARHQEEYQQYSQQQQRRESSAGRVVAQSDMMPMMFASRGDNAGSNGGRLQSAVASPTVTSAAAALIKTTTTKKRKLSLSEQPINRPSASALHESGGADSAELVSIAPSQAAAMKNNNSSHVQHHPPPPPSTPTAAAKPSYSSMGVGTGIGGSSSRPRATPSSKSSAGAAGATTRPKKF